MVMNDKERLRRLRQARSRVRVAIREIDQAVTWARSVNEGVVDRLPVARAELAEYERKMTLSIDLIARYGAEELGQLLKNTYPEDESGETSPQIAL